MCTVLVVLCVSPLWRRERKGIVEVLHSCKLVDSCSLTGAPIISKQSLNLQGNKGKHLYSEPLRSRVFQLPN